MKSHKTRKIKYRRKLQGKTNYKKRLRLLLSKKPRLVVRKSLKNIIAQIIEYHPSGDKLLFSASSKELEKMGWEPPLRAITSSKITGVTDPRVAAGVLFVIMIILYWLLR